MAKRLPQQVVKVKNYGNDWVNRLAVIGSQFEKMSGTKEQAAALRFLISKYEDALEAHST